MCPARTLTDPFTRDVLAHCFDFLNPKELGRSTTVCRSWRDAANNDLLWWHLYERTQTCEGGIDGWAQRQVERPHGRDAVGWMVRVFHEDCGEWRAGMVTDFADGAFNVTYLDGVSSWEQELRETGPWHCRGKSRFSFEGKRPDPLPSHNNGGGAHTPFDDVITSRLKPAASWCSLQALRPLKWKDELRQNTLHLPRRKVAVLNNHRDEVLDLAFSNNGDHLVTASRDMSMVVYDVMPDWTVVVRRRLKSEANVGCHCRVKWSPCDRFLLACVEEPKGNPFGQHSRVELWDPIVGTMLGRFASQPFDLHAAWLADGQHFLSGLGIDLEDSDYSFKQTIGIWKRPPHPAESPFGPSKPNVILPEPGDAAYQQALSFYMQHHATPPGYLGALVPPQEAFPAWLAQQVAGDRTSPEEWGTPPAPGGQLAPGPQECGSPAGKIELDLPGVNFAHFLQVSPSGNYLCFATGDNPYLCHKVCFMSTRGITGVGKKTQVAVGTLPFIDVEGTVLSVTLSRDDKLAFINVRLFARGSAFQAYKTMSREQAVQGPLLDICNKVELQVWEVSTQRKLFTLTGHHAFTTKGCPFLLFTAQSSADPRGDYICSGSEEHHVYLWHLRHRSLLAVLRGHSDVVSSVSWNSKYPGMLATASDDHSVIVWGPHHAPGWVGGKDIDSDISDCETETGGPFPNTIYD